MSPIKILARLLKNAALIVMMIFIAWTPAAHAQERKSVYAVLWRGETAVEKGLRSYIKENDLPIDLIIRSANQDSSKIPDFVEEIHATQPDLVYTWGTPVTLGVVGKYGDANPRTNVTKIPVVFSMVSFPVTSGVVPNFASSGRNITGVSHIAPLEAQIEAMKAYMPVDRIAIIYSPNEPNSLVNVSELQRLSVNYNFRLFPFPVGLDASGQAKVDNLGELIANAAAINPQFLYLGPDSFIGANRKAITAYANANRVATFSATDVMLADAEGLYGLVSPYEDVGRLAGQKMQEILFEDIPPQDIPIETLQRFSYRIRMDVARHLTIFPQMSLLSYAEVLK